MKGALTVSIWGFGLNDGSRAAGRFVYLQEGDDEEEEDVLWICASVTFQMIP